MVLGILSGFADCVLSKTVFLFIYLFSHSFPTGFQVSLSRWWRTWSKCISVPGILPHVILCPEQAMFFKCCWLFSWQCSSHLLPSEEWSHSNWPMVFLSSNLYHKAYQTALTPTLQWVSWEPVHISPGRRLSELIHCYGGRRKVCDYPTSSLSAGTQVIAAVPQQPSHYSSQPCVVSFLSRDCDPAGVWRWTCLQGISQRAGKGI